jgi:hypothetical protein
MGHVLLRSWRLRAAVLCILAVCFAALAATAEATTTTSSSAGATCTTTPGSCTFSGNSSATFAGQFNTPLVVPEPDPADDPFGDITCAPNVDLTDTICGHFGINTNNQQGTITVVINFDPNNDLDLCVNDAAGLVVGSCSLGSGGSEIVTFTVACGDTHFEADILPISWPFPGPPVTSGAYTGSVTASLTNCTTGSNGGGGGGNPKPPSASGGRKMTGGGQISTANVSNNVLQQSDGITYKGKVRFAANGCDIRSTSLDSAEWDDAGQAVIVHGRATINGSGNYLFTLRLDDNGESGRTDLYDMQALCSGAGNMTSGNLQYHLP